MSSFSYGVGAEIPPTAPPLGGQKMEGGGFMKLQISLEEPPSCPCQGVRRGSSAAAWLMEEEQGKGLGAGLSAREITCVLQFPHLLNEVIDASSCTV